MTNSTTPYKKPESPQIGFTLILKAAPTHQGASTAYYFAQSALEAGHRLHGVFFYQDAIYHANRLNSPPQDERNLTDCWHELATRWDVPLLICTAAAQRRGVLDRDSAKIANRDGENCAPGFRIVGLGQLIALSLAADRVITFGASQ